MSTGLPDEPKNWRKLQAKALRERDPVKLATLLNRITKMLSKREKQAKAHGQE